MRVCFVVGTLARGGAEKQLVFMLQALHKLGIAAEVLCLTKGESYEDEIRSTGLNVRHVGESKNRLFRLWTIIRMIREMRADVIQSSHFYTNVYAGAAGRFLSVPSIGAIRSDLSYEIDSHKFTGSWQISLPDVLITNSDIARERLLKRRVDSKKIEFVRNVVEVKNAATNGCSHIGLKILFAGRLDENKRPERFVRLASILTERFPHLEMQFQIAGDGENRKELESTAKLLNLAPDRLRFLGDCHQMSDIYGGADILVSTSDREGTPNVVLEAMAHGLPVVATAVGGTKEILDGTRGFLVQPGDEDALVKATTELISDKGLRVRLGAEGQRYVSENYSLENLQKHLLEIYKRLVSAS
ncbi:MAG: glycosyltransferase family 4 protein [Pyrinomonadaceae bacterium]